MTNKTILILSIFIMLTACNRQAQQPTEAQLPQPLLFPIGETVADIGKNIDAMIQDNADNYWFATNGDGVYRYNGKTLTHLTVKDGLCSDFVWSIAEDPHGYLWFSTRDGICCYNGKVIINYTDTIKNAPKRKLKYTKGGLFFSHLNGVCFYDGKTFTNFVVHPAHYSPPTHTNYRPYEVYCTLADSITGKVYFGMQQKGVAVYDGQTFSYINGKDLDGPAVRAIFQDKKGRLWFGNNGGGLFLYNPNDISFLDRNALRNITEERNLGNYEFLKAKKMVDKLGSLARVFALNDDEAGNLWIGTVDAGVWKYDGANLTNYTTKDGLASNCVYGIYKDKKGKLWFVANGEKIYHFDGQRFSIFNFK